MTCPAIVVRNVPALGGIFGDGERIVEVDGVTIPPSLNQTIASQEDDPDIESVYFLLQRTCGTFSQSIRDSIIEPIRVKVESTQDLSLLTDDERTQARTLSGLYNTQLDRSLFFGQSFPEFGLITP